MSVITISREYGSGGRIIGEKVANVLGYAHMDKDLMVEVARQAQVPVSEVERFDEQPEHPALRVLRKFLTPGYADTLTGLSEYEWWATATVPELSAERNQALSALDEEVYVRLTQEVISQLVEQGDMVLVGRGSQALLADRGDTLHVRVVAPQPFRVDMLMEMEEFGRDEAVREDRKVNEQRKRYLKRHFNIQWEDARHYHLTINTALTGIDAAVRIIAQASKLLPKMGAKETIE